MMTENLGIIQVGRNIRFAVIIQMYQHVEGNRDRIRRETEGRTLRMLFLCGDGSTKKASCAITRMLIHVKIGLYLEHIHL
jgi:hypothetical protein